MLAWLCVAATIAYISRNAISVAESTMRRDLELTKEEMGMVMTVFFLFYSLFQIPTGWLGDRWGTRRSLLACSMVWSLATAAMGVAASMTSLVLARAANGAAQAGLFPCCSNTVSKWFPRTERARANGPLGAFMSIGGAISAALTGLMLEQWGFGWRDVFLCYSGLGIVWGVGFYWWFRDLPQDHPQVSAAELAWIRAGQDALPAAESAQREPTPWAAILSSPAMWWICGQQFFRAAAYMFFASWFPTFLEEARGASVSGSGIYTALPMLGIVLGNLIGGDLSDRILTRTGSRRLARQGVAITGLSLCGLLVWTSYFIHDRDLFIAVISLGTFFFAISSPCSYTIVIDMGGRHVATVFSTMNLAGNIGAMLFPILLPRFQDAYGWNAVIVMFGGMYMAAAAMWLLLKPDGSIFEQSLIPSRRQTPTDDSR